MIAELSENGSDLRTWKSVNDLTNLDKCSYTTNDRQASLKECSGMNLEIVIGQNMLDNSDIEFEMNHLLETIECSDEKRTFESHDSENNLKSLKDSPTDTMSDYSVSNIVSSDNDTKFHFCHSNSVVGVNNLHIDCNCSKPVLMDCSEDSSTSKNQTTETYSDKIYSLPSDNEFSQFQTNLKCHEKNCFENHLTLKNFSKYSNECYKKQRIAFREKTYYKFTLTYVQQIKCALLELDEVCQAVSEYYTEASCAFRRLGSVHLDNVDECYEVSCACMQFAGSAMKVTLIMRNILNSFQESHTSNLIFGDLICICIQVVNCMSNINEKISAECYIVHEAYKSYFILNRCPDFNLIAIGNQIESTIISLNTITERLGYVLLALEHVSELKERSHSSRSINVNLELGNQNTNDKIITKFFTKFRISLRSVWLRVLKIYVRPIYVQLKNYVRKILSRLN